MQRLVFASLVAFAIARSAAADPMCRTVELRFSPTVPDLQIAVWIEDAKGNYVDTVYLTRLTGIFGLGNRPGTPLLKTDFRWPYGRREMVLPVWAFHHNHHYPKVVMGGVCGNSTASLCPDNSPCAGDCDDTTIAYHSRVSSYEPFYCSPSGASKIDAMSCASKGTFSKGAYADNTYSLYPPRADLMAFSGADSTEAQDFAKQNDLVAVSQATPAPNGGQPLDPPVTWYPNNFPDGDYVAWIEVSQESDFNGAHNSQSQPNQPDTVQAWDFEGHPFLGQPSIVYKVPFHLGPDGYTNATSAFAGYGSWDGRAAHLKNGRDPNPDDGTITTDKVGSGARRLADINDGVDNYRFKVVAGGCGGADGGMGGADGGVHDGGMSCQAPNPVENVKATAESNTITITFSPPSGGQPANRYQVRYQEGTMTVTDENFSTMIPAPDPTTSNLSSRITGLVAQRTYTVAVRGVSPCGQPSHPVAVNTATTAQQFVVLHGCFVATAAYGSPMAGDVQTLRRFRDTRLLENAAGRLFVAAYYGLSPPAAAAIAGDARLRAGARLLLAPLVELAKRLGAG